MEIPQLEPESKPMVFKVWSADGADQLTRPWMCQSGYGVMDHAHWDQAIDCALSHSPKRVTIPKFSVGDTVTYWYEAAGAFYVGEITYLDEKGVAVVAGPYFRTILHVSNMKRVES